MKKNRWYDKHEALANHLESLKTMPKRRLNEMLKDLIALARLLHPTLFEEHLLEYPLDMKKRRWYDDDPYLWILVNGLRFAEDEVIRKVVAFFDKQTGGTGAGGKREKKNRPAPESGKRKTVPSGAKTSKKTVAGKNGRKSPMKKKTAASPSRTTAPRKRKPSSKVKIARGKAPAKRERQPVSKSLKA